jgi:hypothetical protein
MSYSVQLNDRAMAKIVAWRLPKERMSAIIRRMDQMEGNLSRNVLRVESSTHPLQSDVVFRDSPPPARDWLVVPFLPCNANEKTLTIVDCDVLTLDQLP